MHRNTTGCVARPKGARLTRGDRHWLLRSRDMARLFGLKGSLAAPVKLDPFRVDD